MFYYERSIHYERSNDRPAQACREAPTAPRSGQTGRGAQSLTARPFAPEKL